MFFRSNCSVLLVFSYHHSLGFISQSTGENPFNNFHHLTCEFPESGFDDLSVLLFRPVGKSLVDLEGNLQYLVFY